MKHTVSETLEILAWTFLAIVLALAMTVTQLRVPDITENLDPTTAAIIIFSTIIFGAVIFILVSKYKDRLPKWFFKGLIGFGAIVFIYAIGRASSNGIKLLQGNINMNVISAQDIIIGLIAGIMMLCIIWIIRNREKYNKFVPFAVRMNNIVMMFIFGSAAAFFATKLTPWTAVILLFFVGCYDAYAVWGLETMQSMAMELASSGFLPGIAVPKKTEDKASDGQMKIGVALLGGGDVLFVSMVGAVFWIAGYGLLPLVGMFSAITWLFFFSKPNKFYPAIPYIFAGLLLGIFVQWLTVIL